MVLWVSLLVVFSSIHLVSNVPLEYLYNKCEYLEMSYEFNSDTIYWPTVEPFKKDIIFAGKPPGKDFYYVSDKHCAAEHGGTHVDAPSHFSETGKTLDQLPLTTFIGEAFVVNVSEKVKKNRDYAVTAADIEDYVKKNGKIEDHAILIIYTGYGAYWPHRKEYLGSDVPHDASNLHFPGVSAEAAVWIVNNSNINVLGIDTASLDPGPSQEFPVHRILLGKNISFFENLRNVDKLPPRGATVVGLPTFITGASGGPLRAFAIGWNGAEDPCRMNTGTSFNYRLLADRYFIGAFLLFSFIRQRFCW